MFTGDRAESSIHDFIPDDRDDLTGNRDNEIAELKSQLDNILEHVYTYSHVY